MDIHSAEITLSNLFWLPSEKGSTLKGKNLHTLEANSVLLQKSPLSEVAWCIQKQTGCQKVVSFEKMSENLRSVSLPL